jgi:hypothetical protein
MRPPGRVASKQISVRALARDALAGIAESIAYPGAER